MIWVDRCVPSSGLRSAFAARYADAPRLEKPMEALEVVRVLGRLLEVA